VTKLVIASLKRKNGKATTPKVGKKRVVGPQGKTTSVWQLDARSRSFGDDLQYVFAKNVAKARRTNKRVVGSADVAPRKR
jgi:hypothetical protein